MQTTAIVFPEVNRVVLETIELPPLRSTDAYVQVELSGVSVGTEIWALTGQRPPGDTTFPCVPGYQAVGVVLDAGPDAALRSGERVFFTKTRLLPPHSNGNWMGSHVRIAVLDASDESRHGYWVRLPDTVTPQDAVLSALAAVTTRGLNHVGVNSSDLCVVTGLGVIGQTAAQVARIMGATVLGVDTAANRLDLAKNYSADLVFNPSDGDVGSEVRRFKQAGADLVVEASGNKQLIDQAISLIRPLGRVLLQGWYPGDVSFDFHKAHARRPTIAVTCGMDRESNEQAIQWIADRKLKLAPLLTHVFRHEKAPEAYEMMRTSPGEFLGVAFDWRNE